MNYMDEIFLRADIQQIREFLLHGVEEANVDLCSYKERTERALKRVTALLHAAYPEEAEYENAFGLVCECVRVHENVYMEIGLQVGTMLAAQVFQNLKTAYGKDGL